jgi:hypothetical protein
MTPTLIVIDDFFEDPYAVREAGLNTRFDFVANYPGMRTSGLPLAESLKLKQKFEDILHTPITRWDTFDGDSKKQMNTCFQLCLQEDYTWVHHDLTDWAAICYLTPDANPDSGTGLFTHIETGTSRWIENDPSTEFNKTEDMYDLSRWQLNLEVKNKFNRLILYPGCFYHRSMIPGFGNNYITGRLTQVFFFNTNE